MIWRRAHAMLRNARQLGRAGNVTLYRRVLMRLRDMIDEELGDDAVFKRLMTGRSPDETIVSETHWKETHYYLVAITPDMEERLGEIPRPDIADPAKCLLHNLRDIIDVWDETRENKRSDSSDPKDSPPRAKQA